MRNSDTGSRKKTTRQVSTGGTTRSTSRVGTGTGKSGKATGSTQRGNAPPQPKGANNQQMMIGGIVGGVVLVILLIVVMSSGTDPVAERKDLDLELTKAINRVSKATSPQEQLELLNKILSTPKFAKLDRFKECEANANNIRATMDVERTAQIKVPEFLAKVEDARKKNTAMQQSKAFLDECLGLLQAYGQTSRGADLKAIKEDLVRWSATEGQGDWQKDYNRTKEIIQRDWLSKGNYTEAIRQWKQFSEISKDGQFRAKVDSEVTTINKQATDAANKIIEAGGSGEELRSRIEEALTRFTGTDGQAILIAKMKTIK